MMIILFDYQIIEIPIYFIFETVLEVELCQ